MKELSHWNASNIQPTRQRTPANDDVGHGDDHPRICSKAPSDLCPPANWLARRSFRFDGPLSFMGNDGVWSSEHRPGHTIGAALALKDSDRLTIGVIGDGDYLMGIALSGPPPI